MPKSIFPFLRRLFSLSHKLAEIFCPPLSFKKKTDAPVHTLPQFIFLKMGIIPDKGLPKSALIPLSLRSYLGKKCFPQLLSPVAYLYYGPRQWKHFLLCYFHMAVAQFAAQPPQSLISNLPEVHLVITPASTPPDPACASSLSVMLCTIHKASSVPYYFLY